MTRVAFDLTPLRAGDTGVAHYARSLHDQLLADHDDIELRTFTIGRGQRPDLGVDRHVAVPLRVVHRAWATVRLPRAEHVVGPIDVVHATDMVPPPSRHPIVLTVHDVLPLRLPDRYGRRFVRTARAQLDAARHRADVVLSTCQATADDIAALGVPAHRITVAPLGHRPVPPVAPEPLVSPPYLLYVGAITPRKGLEWLIAAVAGLPPASPPLVVAGPDGWAADRVRSAAAGTDRVRFLGRVPDADLTRLYAHATILCHPSEAEGFGLPVLEAMAFGVPVVAGDTPQAAEVGGDAAIRVPAGAPSAWREALADLLGDDAERERRGRLGQQQAAAFTWARCADIVAGVYRSLG